MNLLGFDIGGANTKIAHSDGMTRSQDFAIWREPERLTDVLTEMIRHFPQSDVFAVTMTAELADCFATKADGVDQILTAVERVADGVPVFVWQTGAEFVPPDVAREIPLLVAAANWHALATWLGRMVPDGPSLLIDIGTTTTDLIPLLDGVPIPTGMTDRERLTAGELVYSGVRRTPLCAIAHTVPFREGYCPLATELFATTLDLYLLLDAISEDHEDCNTANNRPATKAAARTRLSRMLCCDETEVTAEELQSIARFLADVHRQRITGPLKKVLRTLKEEAGDRNCQQVILSGSGSFLADEIARDLEALSEAKVHSVSDWFDEQSAEAACALAVARLGSERLRQV